MFDQLFSLPAVRARHRIAPLAEERIRFLQHVAELGLSRRTLLEFAPLLLVIVERLDLANRPRVCISQEEIRRKATTKSEPFVSVATRWLRFLGQLEQPPKPVSRFADKIAAFADVMRNKDLSPVTIHERCWIVQRVLDQLASPDGSLGAVSVGEIDSALLRLIYEGGYTRRTIQGWTSHLRVFLRFAETRGWCRDGLAAAIQSPRVYTHSLVPVGPSWNEVRRLLAMTQGNRPADIRDRAVLMLLAIYGLRTDEVRHLRLDDLDWESETIRVACPKTKRVRTSPLVRSVGDAILRYLREVRPQSVHRELFLTLLPPIRPLRGMWDLVGKRLRKLGVKSPHQGPHALRHACATHLLAEGFSLKEIGDHLGHQLPNTTRIYAKVDFPGLRKVADFDLGGVL
jgi:site-specific recombinase XerD